MSNARFSIIQAKAVRDRRVSDSVLRTLCALGLYSDKDGWCFPAQEALAQDTDKSRQTVNQHIKFLVDFGYLEKHPRFDEDGGQTSNMYRLVFDAPLSNPDLTPPVKPRLDTNVPSNDPINTNTANGENQPCRHLPAEFDYICMRCRQVVKKEEPKPIDPTTPLVVPLEWQILAGVEKLTLPDAQEASYKDTAWLIATGTGGLAQRVFDIAYVFMKTRGIVIPFNKIKGQRKAIKEMIEMNVLPEHVEEATKKLIDNHMTVTDLYSVAKTAIDLANPAPDEPSKFEGI